ncbi:MAG: BlaI/MecI/CopY family transcriptional regulator [Tessaracoccus sp.]
MTTDTTTHRHPTKPDGPARLGALETQVMNLLWCGDSLTIREIITQLPSEPAYTTIATVLTNLHKKDLVCSRKEGHHTQYFACLRPEEYAAQVMTHALDTSHDREASIRHFVNNMAESDLELMCQYLAQRKRGTSS